MTTTKTTVQKKNFTPDEKEIFLHLIKQERCLWADKSESASVNVTKSKNEAWTRIWKSFNSTEGNCKRDIKQLKKLWDNLKTERKRKLAAAKQDAMKTGGGVIEKTVEEEADLDVLLDQAVDLEHSSAIDSDTVLLAVGTSTSTSTPMLDLGLFESSESRKRKKSTAGSSINLSNEDSTSNLINVSENVAGASTHLSTADEQSQDSDLDELMDEGEIQIDDNVLNTALTRTKKRSKGSYFEGVCNLQKKIMVKEHNLRNLLLKEKLEAAKEKKRYYKNKNKDFSM